MAKRARRALPVAVKRLQERIEQWRRTRERRTAMPVELWSEAVALAKREGTHRIARALRIDFDGLRRRMAEATVGGASTGMAASGFVEVTGAQILDVGAETGTVVEVEDEAGRLVIRLAREERVDVAQLVSGFRRRGA